MPRATIALSRIPMMFNRPRKPIPTQARSPTYGRIIGKTEER